MVAVYYVKRRFGGIENEFGRVVAKETLTHIYDGLDGGGGCCFVDDGPVMVSMAVRIILKSKVFLGID